MRGSEYAQLKAFAKIVARGTFARAAAELGVSASTLSQTIRELEARLGVRLLNRSTRSLSLTDAGQRLHARFKPAMLEMEAAATDVMSLRDRPAGTVRIHIATAPAAAYLEPVLGRFHAAYPDIVLDVTVEDTVPDIVGSGFDLGVRLGESLEADMVAVKLGGEQRQLVVASPDYIARHGAPEEPSDLLRHRCINWRQPGTAGLHKWDFVKDGRALSVAVTGPLIVSQRAMAVAAAVQGVGTFPGWYLCYPKQRYMAASIRAFVDFFRSPDGR